MKREYLVHPVLIFGVLSICGYAFLNLFKNHKIFISYYYRNDSKYKNILKAWSSNKEFDMSFDDMSADISINSDNDSSIKRVLSKKIKEADVFVILIGEATHKRKWIVWEINKAKQLKKKIIAVKLNNSYKTPRELLSSDVIWSKSFRYKSIMDAINR